MAEIGQTSSTSTATTTTDNVVAPVVQEAQTVGTYSSATYYSNHRDDILAKAKIRSLINVKERKDYRAIYNKSLVGKYNSYKYSAKARSLPFDITLEQFELFWQKPCFYCNEEIETVGIDRIDSSIGYCVGNLRSCCTMCNYMKLDWSEEEFISKILSIATNIKSRE